MINFIFVIIVSFFIFKRVGSITQSIPLVFGFWFLYLLVFFVWNFTKPLTAENEGSSGKRDVWQDPKNVEIKRHWMVISYCFMILSLSAAVIPFAIDRRKEPWDTNWEKGHFERADSPISVIRVCILDPIYHGTPLYCYGDDDPASPW